MQYDESLIKRVPIDYDIRKIGFVLLPDEKEPVKNVNTQCHICNRVYKTRSNLKRHLETVHAERVLKCEICKSNGVLVQFDTLRKLTYHKRYHKLPLKTIEKSECNLCGTKEKKKEELDQHAKLHSCSINIHDVSRP